MYHKLATAVGSKKFFYVIVALLVLQALWLALSGRYPMAFDEDFHLGVIRLYAHHLSPFWSNQPANADVYGAVYRDPSYLYHYLMSFPYRFIQIFTNDTTIQVLLLRFINIGLFASCLPIFRKLLLKTRASITLVHVVLLLFVLIPIVPFLAAQVNYDNLFIPLTALSLLLTFRVSHELQAYKRLNVEQVSLLAVVTLLTSLVKYPFLPILVAIWAFLLVTCYYYLGRRRKFWRTLGFGITLITPKKRWLLVALVAMAAFLFSQRYLINIIDYHKPVPSCDQVLNVERCKAYGPWNRDYNLSLVKPDRHDGPILYTGDWAYGMWLRTFFAVDGPASNFETRGPLILPATAAIVFAGIGAVLFLAYLRSTIRKYNGLAMALFAGVISTYSAVLWVDNYQAYLRTGQPVAVSGRYLLVIYPLLMLLLGLGYSQLLRRYAGLKLAVIVVVIVCFIWGGGFLTYILRSRDAWLWPTSAVSRPNSDVRNWIAPITPGSRQPTEFLPGS